ncbi:MAG: META domain-containing protein [Salinarimonas sp.]|nr:META domain-containing protein [Salinarimonas sp.]
MKALRVAALCLIAGLALPTPSALAQAQGQEQEENLVPQPMREKQFPINVSYSVVSLNGRAFPGENPAMILDSNFRLSGFGGCNNYSAIAYPQLEQGIAVGPFALTNRECGREVMSAERGFLEALRAAREWDTQGNRLTLNGPRGELVLERSM